MTRSTCTTPTADTTAPRSERATPLGSTHGPRVDGAAESSLPATRPGARLVSMTARQRPPFVADERTQLLGWYSLQREIVHFKCAGLADADAHRSLIPTSPLMTVAGIVAHLRWTEHTWFEVAFRGGDPSDSPAFDEEVEDLDMMAEGRSLADLLDAYRRQCERSDEIIAAHNLDDTGRYDGFPSAGSTLRWMIIHMVEETARHVGHLDLIREMLDGERGYY